MDLWIKILGSVALPALLCYIGWRGIKPVQRKGAVRVILILCGVIMAGTAVFIVVMIDMTPKWVAQDCDAAYREIAQGAMAAEPTLAREPFLAACSRLSMSAAECTLPSRAQKFRDSCNRYAAEIRAVLPKLDLELTQRPPK